MKILRQYILYAFGIIFLSWLGWWWSYDLSIVGDKKLGDLWSYWAEFNQAFSMGSGLGLVIVLVVELTAKERKDKE